MTDRRSMKPEEVVRAFFIAWESDFKTSFEEFIHPDGVWQNTGFPDCVGKRSVMELLDYYLKVTDLPYGRAELINIMSSGDTVLTERVDHLWNDKGKKHSAKIMGALQVKDGMIIRYSDYLDSSVFKGDETFKPSAVVS
jgi:limonene-1,2-epoxide hydrolase